MKRLFTLSLLTFLSVQLFAQDAGFYPPEGSTFNEDSTVVTLPSTVVNEPYTDTIKFYATNELTIEGVSFQLEFVSAMITSVATPSGLDYSCNVDSCLFLANNWGEVILAGTPTEVGEYTLEITADVVVSIPPLLPGMPSTEIPFSLPYNGGDALLDGLLMGDYSPLNSFIPTFILNITPEVGIEELASLSDLVVAPNPAQNEAKFTFYNQDSEVVTLQVFDLLGNLISSVKVEGEQATRQTINLNTSEFNNGVYLYKLTSLNDKQVGRLVVNK